MQVIDSQTLQAVPAQRPQPGIREVLIEVVAAGINRPDLVQLQGAYAPPPGASPILGLEVAGRVVEVGELVTEWRVGDAVCALLTGGGYAEYCLADAGSCLPVPACLSFVEAAALPETFFTVWSTVFQRGELSPYESLLVHGGSSGIGTTAIQLARAFGSPVYVTAGSAEKCQRCVELGATAAINYREQDFVAEIARLTEGQGVNVLLDMIGGYYLPRNIKCLATEGRLLQIAIQQGMKGELNLWSLMAKRLTIMGSTLRSRDDHYKSVIARELHQQVWPLLETRQIAPVIDGVFAFDQAEQAHQRMASNQHFGKLVLQVSS